MSLHGAGAGGVGELDGAANQAHLCGVKGSCLQGCQRPAPRGDGLENSIPT
jgi:hypothetical protein